MTRGPLLIVGASGRAATASALRAGYEPFVIDLFADEDTRRICPTIRCDLANYPQALVELAEHAPDGPWMYTGGLENHPTIVEDVSRSRHLIGNGVAVINLVRDPFRLESFIVDTGLRMPKTFRSIPAQGTWLLKPFSGSGGRGIRRLTCLDSDSASHYYQQYLEGNAYSLLARTDDGATTIIGHSRQLTGEPWLHAPAFAYAGSVGPLVSSQCINVSPVVARTGLNGLWGLDYIRHCGNPFLLEINPRYTASAELYEYATGSSVWDEAGSSREISRSFDANGSQRIIGKAIYYAPLDIAFPSFGPWKQSLPTSFDLWQRPDFADIPAAGSVIARGQPVLTILDEADTEDNCLIRLKVRAAALDRLFGELP